jgi:hypothetical protein
MNSTQSHAKRELDILTSTVSDAIVRDFKPEILDLCEAFGNSGQSGGSAPYTAHAITATINKLLNFETISPLTGEDYEWNDITEMNGGKKMYQNNRDGRVFKNEDGRASFIDAIVFDGDIGGRFTGNGSVTHGDKTIGSSQYIKSFPFEPKTFYIDVTDYRWKDKEEKISDPNGDWWTHSIKDESQLKEVFEYYDIKQS